MQKINLKLRFHHCFLVFIVAFSNLKYCNFHKIFTINSSIVVDFALFFGIVGIRCSRGLGVIANVVYQKLQSVGLSSRFNITKWGKAAF